MTLTRKVLELVAKSRQGVCMSMIDHALLHHSKSTDSIHVLVCNAVRNGLLRTDGHFECDKCHSRKVNYRITDKGRMHLHG